MGMGKKNMTYPSRTPEAFRLQKREQRRREAELLQRVNERLAAHNIDWKQLMRLVASGEAIITVNEKTE